MSENTTTLSDLTAIARRAQASALQADADQAQLRRALVVLDRQEDGPSRNELARVAAGGLSRRLVLATLQSADLLATLVPLLRKPGAPRPSEDSLDLFAAPWHAQARTSGHVVLTLVPDVEPGDGLDTEHERRRLADRMIERLTAAGIEVRVQKSAGKRATDELADFGKIYLTAQ